MRRSALVLLVVIGMAPASGGMAHAQVTVNQRALEQLGGAPASQPAPVHRPPVRAYRYRYHHERYHHVRRLPLPPPYVPVPVIAMRPPPLPPPQPPAPPKVVTRVLTFVFPGTAPELPQAAAQRLDRLVAAPGVKSDRFILAATAPGEAGDPSVARRLSLERGLAIQAKLLAAGVPPERILLQALGAVPHQPDDRVTVTQIMTEPSR